MLRLLVLLLFIANILVYGWTRGWLDDAVGIRHDAPREPLRETRQVHPEAIRLIQGGAVAPTESLRSSATLSPLGSRSQPGPNLTSVEAGTMVVASAPTSSGPAATALCFAAGPFDLAQRKEAESSLATLGPVKSWEIRSEEKVGLWMVYMGRYPSEDALRKKADELRRIRSIHIEFSEVRTPPELSLGLSLGRFQQRANAEAALADFNKRGVRTARIVTLKEPHTTFTVRFPRADEQTLRSLRSLTSGVWVEKAFSPCDGGGKP